MGNLHYMASVEARLNVRIWLASWETFVLVVKNFLGNQRAENYTEHREQCCHSEKMENPRWANKKTKKTQGRISLKLLVIYDFFPENVTFPEQSQLFPAKVIFYPPKFLMTFFLVID